MKKPSLSQRRRLIPAHFQPLLRALIAAAGIGLLHTGTSAQTAFYATPAAGQIGPPGTLLRSEPMHWGVPPGAHAWRILYASTGLHGKPIAVSGMVVAPDGAAPATGRPVVAWAHPTSGVVPRCAPSLAWSAMRSIQGLPEMLARGEVVVATDYPGLGTQGPHPYLVGASAGAAVLDSVRAARQLQEAHAGSRFAAWGHSQGGHAVLFAGLMAARYAPELQLVGVAAAAPATDLETLMRDDFDSTGGRNLTAMTLWSWSRVYGAPIQAVVAPSAMPTVDALADECIESIYDVLRRQHTGKGLAKTFLTVPDITRVEPWQTLMRDNIPGPLPPNMPLMLVQGDADTLVLPQVTTSYMRKLCARGSNVTMLTVHGDGHGFVARDAAPQAVGWIADRFAGRPVRNDCAAVNVAVTS
ncbi:lipase family protein [Variovorax robiniae]|uniref:Lipase family protein n=1 Tax=Variovorax robiniae TaxID=1836199 RepID=A0ABU8X288_9BURK